MPASNVCTTQEAANILGVSVSTIQQLVEAGKIEAWKTKGGHRRIPMAAVQAYKNAPAETTQVSKMSSGLAANADSAPPPLTILVIEDNRMQRELYQHAFASWDLNLQTAFCDNGYKALVEITRKKPHVVIADILMDGMDGYEVVKTLLSYPELSAINIAIATSLDIAQLQARGGVPVGVAYFHKPVNLDEIRGFLKACSAQRTRPLFQV